MNYNPHTKKMALSILDRADTLDGYLTAIRKSPANSAARSSYVYEMDAISPEVAAAILSAANTIPLLATTRAEIVILNSTADGGMPHTRAPNLLCLPKGLCEKAYKDPTEFRTTLLHEAIHIHQRLYPDLWAKALQAAGWTPQPPAAIPSALKERIRINPDTLASPFWAWNSYHIPIPLFSFPPKLTSAPIEWYDTRTGALFHDPPVSFPKDAQLDEASAYEHPFELYAYRFSKEGIDTDEKLQRALQSISSITR